MKNKLESAIFAIPNEVSHERKSKSQFLYYEKIADVHIVNFFMKLVTLLQHSYAHFMVFGMYFLSTTMAVFYIFKNRLPLAWDQSAYMQVSAQIGHAISRFDWLNVFKIFIWHDTWSNRPALHMLVGGIYASLTQFDMKLTVILSNMTWVAIIFYLIYKLSEYLQKNSGVLSVFLFSTSYGLLYLYRDFLSELALTAGVLLVLYAYIMSDHLEKRRWSILTALFMIFGALTKESFILYIFPIVIYSVLDFIYYKKYKSHDCCINWLIVFVMTSFVIAAFYIPIMDDLLRNMSDNVGNKVGKFFSRPYTKDSLHYYAVYLYFFSDLIFIPCLITSLGIATMYLLTGQIKKLNFKGEGLLLLVCVFFPLVVLTFFVTDTDVRFIFPILPFVLIFCSMMIRTLSWALKWLVMSFLCVASILNLVSSFIPIIWLPDMIHLGEFTIYRQHYNEGGPRGVKEMHIDVTGAIKDIFAFFRTYKIKEKRIGILPSLAYLNNNIMNSYAAMYDEHQYFLRVMSLDDLKGVDYVVTTDKVFTAAPWEKSGPLEFTSNAIMHGLQTEKYIVRYSKNISIDENRIYLVDLKKP